ncbi:MAG: M20/M25/M40 family metallo-hydrolase [Pseudobacteriovorax sp.]|nr:M20/M25/M40 family metallo-hydrolase [Pseudobacteriovorax sp.]
MKIRQPRSPISMMNRLLVWTSIIWAQASFCLPSQPEFISAQINPQTVWHDRWFSLSGVEIPDTDADSMLAIVKYPRSHQLALSVIKSSKVLTSESYDFYSDIALVEVSSMDELNLLAQTVHEAGSACGLIQVLDPNSRLAAVDALKAPIFSSLVTLNEIETLYPQVSQDQILEDVTLISSLESRHHSTGTVASEFLQDLFIEATGDFSGATISLQEHPRVTQKSVIVKIPGEIKTDETIVIGAHLDSINFAGVNAAAPGADDDASGLAVLLQIYRIIAQNNLSFQRNIELQAYAAEEIGLIGSQDIANNRSDIVGMMQVDMALYGENGDDGIIYLVRDDTSNDTNRSAINFMTNYQGFTFGQGFLPQGATSDHRSFYQVGIPTLFAFEDPLAYNRAIHSFSDTIDRANNPSLAANIAKLAMTYLSHYAGLRSLESAYAATDLTQVLPASGDVYLAALASQESGKWFLSASVPGTVSVVEICRIESAESLDCASERLYYSQNTETSSGRLIFYRTEAVAINSGANYRVWAYNAEHELLLRRDVAITTNGS